jgi:hypothetical protein
MFCILSWKERECTPNLVKFVGFEVLTAVSTKMAIFWVVAPCSLVEVYQRFRGPCRLHHQGDECSSPWWWRRYNPEDSHLPGEISYFILISKMRALWFRIPHLPLCLRIPIINRLLQTIQIWYTTEIRSQLNWLLLPLFIVSYSCANPDIQATFSLLHALYIQFYLRGLSISCFMRNYTIIHG